MNDLLLSEIKSEQKNLLSSLVLVEEYIFAETPKFESNLDEIIEQCRLSIAEIEESMDKAECLINELYVNQLFLDKERSLWPVISHQISTAVDYKLMAPVIKAAIIQKIVNACDLEAEIVFVPETIMVRIICDDVYSIIFDPTNGESLNWQQLDSRLGDVEGDPTQIYLDPMEIQSILVEYLTSLKKSLIHEMQFDKALKCVDLLLALRPNDPFERRDRGFLLHQLDCFKVAYDDYQFFVKECPKDPAAQLLKIQLDKITIADTVLH
ncbi:MAG: tetratricopeptide repeat protein [Colwelliaceae bacterium]|nr:tetratricopeptide repeat protein [Colwelliaceae bacterium]